MRLRIDLGRALMCKGDKIWVYTGYRTTSVGTEDHHFVEVYYNEPEYHRSELPERWTYHAMSYAALTGYFPELAAPENWI